MTPPLPKQIREAVEKELPNCHEYIEGAEWLYSHLTGLAEKGVSPILAKEETERLHNYMYELGNLKHDSMYTNYFAYTVDGYRMGKIFQHAQGAAKIAQLELERAEFIKEQSRQSEVIADLKRQLAEAKEDSGFWRHQAEVNK